MSTFTVNFDFKKFEDALPPLQRPYILLYKRLSDGKLMVEIAQDIDRKLNRFMGWFFRDSPGYVIVAWAAIPGELFDEDYIENGLNGEVL